MRVKFRIHSQHFQGLAVFLELRSKILGAELVQKLKTDEKSNNPFSVHLTRYINLVSLKK
jgi:hypothetical protein